MENLSFSEENRRKLEEARLKALEIEKSQGETSISQEPLQSHESSLPSPASELLPELPPSIPPELPPSVPQESLPAPETLILKEFRTAPEEIKKEDLDYFWDIVTKLRGVGMPDNQIADKVSRVGWTEERIEEAGRREKMDYLRQYVKERREVGFSDEAITGALTDKGWPLDLIRDAFDFNDIEVRAKKAEPPVASEMTLPPSEPPKVDEVPPAPAPVPEAEKKEGVEAEQEKKEKIENPLEKTREEYVRVADELRSANKEIYDSFIGGLTRDELRAANPDSFQGVEKLLEKFVIARGNYFEERQKDVKEKLEIFDQEILANLPEQAKSQELKDFMIFHLAHEFKNNYDLETKIKAEQESKDKPWILDKLHELGNKYKELPLKKKLLISGALLGGGVVAGAVGGGAGLALATLVGGGRLTQRLLSSGAAFIGLEGLIKKQQMTELKKEKMEKYQEDIRHSLEGSFSSPKDPSGILKFLKINEGLMEHRAELSGRTLKQLEKSRANRRYLLAGSISALTLLGLTSDAIGNVVHGLGFHPEQFFAEPKVAVPEIKPENIIPGKAAEMMAAAKAPENIIATVKEGGSISQAARSLLTGGKISKEDFAGAWRNSFVEVNGLKVPISDVSLSHAGDQVVYVGGVGEAPGHFEVLDYAKDKLSLGSNRDLQSLYEMKDETPPDWLKVATAEDYKEAFKDNNLDANDVANVKFNFEHSNLNEQDEVMARVHEKMALEPGKGGRDFANLFTKLETSPTHEWSVDTYKTHIKLLELKPGQYENVKNMTVKDLMEKHGRSWWFDIFRSDSYMRKVVSHIRKLGLSELDKKLTVDQFFKTNS